MNKLEKLLVHLRVVLAEDQVWNVVLSEAQMDNALWFSTLDQRRRAFKRAMLVEPRLTIEQREGSWMLDSVQGRED